MNKEMLLKLFIVLIISFVHFTCSLAKEWKPGYLITNKNDTLHGLIAYSGDGNEWENCTFKSNTCAEEQSFLPKDIKSFTYDSGLCYKSMNVTVGKMKGMYFVRSLVEGVCSISNLDVDVSPDSIYTIYIIENKETHKTIRIPAEDPAFLIYKKRLRSVLKPFFNNHPLMTAELKKSNLSIKELIRLFKKYNDLICIRETCVTYEENKKNPPRFFISARLLFQYAGIPQINHPGYRENAISLRDFKFNMGVGIVGSMTLLKHYDLLLLNVGLDISPLSFSTDPNKKQLLRSKGIGITNTLSLEAHWFNKVISPFIEVGGFQTGAIPTGQTRKPARIKKYYLGVMLSVGADIQVNRKHSIPVRFSLYEPIYNAKYKYSDIRPGRYQLAIGYTFQIR